jgi:RNA polymerase sigma-70 factor (ECF subfamily)
MVRQASDPAQQTLAMQAMGAFCADYWYPIYAFARRKGFNKESAEDLTQGFFERLSEEQLLAKAEHGEIRLRTYLLRLMQAQLKRERERAGAQKRGGHLQKLSLDFQDAEGRYLLEPEDQGLTPEALFDRTWALATLDRCLARLAQRWDENGRSEEFTILRPFLNLNESGDSTAGDVASKLGITDENARQKIKRLRAALREVLHDQVASSLADASPEAVAAEIQNLRATLL